MISYRMVLVGYALYILIGLGLLSLPVSHRAADIDWLDHFFTASSAVSTTGLTTVPINETYSIFGQLAILLLVQVGGIGYMTLGSFAILAMTQHLSENREQVAKQVFSLPENFQIGLFLRNVVVWTVAIEAVGAAVLYWRFTVNSIEQPLWHAVFHSISSFCTAGFSPFPDSFQRFANDPWVLGTTATLALTGALGFVVLSDVHRIVRDRHQATSLTSRTILVTTGVLVSIGALGLFWVEPTIVQMPLPQRTTAALFQSINALTTTGFSSFPMSALRAPAVLLVTLMMICGASPAGTGGGLKSTSVAAALATTWAMLRGHRHVRLLGTEIPERRVRLALASIVFYVLIYFLGFLSLSIFEVQELADLGFETASALGTVGLSRGITGDLSLVGKLILIALMYVGRIGPITFGLALFFDSHGVEPDKHSVPPETSAAQSEEDDLAVS